MCHATRSNGHRRRRRLNADDSPDSNANGTALEGADALLDTEETGSLRESGGTGAGNDAETRSVSDDEEDDGDASDPPPMEYDADRDREIDEDPDNSDGGGGDPDEVRMRQFCKAGTGADDEQRRGSE